MVRIVELRQEGESYPSASTGLIAPQQLLVPPSYNGDTVVEPLAAASTVVLVPARAPGTYLAGLDSQPRCVGGGARSSGNRTGSSASG